MSESTNIAQKTTFYKQESGKVLPHTTDMEEAVIGAILIEKDAFSLINELLTVKSFYNTSHQIIFEAIRELYEESEPIDVLNVIRKLRKSGTIQQVGGSKYIASLAGKINSSTNIEYHAMAVAQSAIKRDMIRVADDILNDSYDEQNDVFNLLDKTEQSFFGISEKNIRKNYLDANSIMRLTIDELEFKKKNNSDGLTGVPSGFTDLDRLTGGWQKTELTIIAARPGMGKTAFVVSSMRNAAVNFDTPIAIFSLEMSATQLMLRMISAEAEIDSEKLRKGTLQSHEWQQLHHRIDKLSKSSIFIDDTPALSILELRAKCRRLKAQHDIQMVIIDYLQLMTGDDGSGIAGNREQEIAAISRALKNLAKELDVPVLALSQLSRAVETRGGDKRPQLSDLRESGSIEQDADMVMFLYRPEYYKITEDENGNSTEGVGEVIIAKNRAGTIDTIKLQFIGKYTKFGDLNAPMSGFGDNNSFKSFTDNSGFSHFESPRQQQDDGLKTFGSKANNKPDIDSDPLEEYPF
ncbi:replicative DNA helicase [Emticicia sp. CRIBPO]|uniref:replicative DNA helicase n=1 Tax=Emticicia sp. CRIBPO TaxID=2683258 RepID=UPI001E648A37|nr:replicative DNA helicase [Emticicia sp. CRIBPO]